MPANITITARLARPPEVRESNSGTTICTLTLPNDTGWGDNKTTTWWSCVLFGKRAEAAAKHLDKGQWVTVSGEPSLRKYNKRDGTQGTSLEVKVHDWGFCGPKVQQSQSERVAQDNGRSRSNLRGYPEPIPGVPF